jgi:transcriptional regulator MraZ
VARRFRGESTHKVDAKGRVSIPASFRRVLEENDPDWIGGLNPNVIIVYGDKSRDFLEGYSIASMEELERKIEALEDGTPKRRYMERVFSGQSIQTQVDETGRLVLPPKLREKIGITNEAYFIGALKTFQIWQPEAYQSQTDRYDHILSDAGADIDPLSLLHGQSGG